MDANTILYTIVWALLLLFIAWPLGWFCVSWYILLMPFESIFLVIFNSDVVYTVDDFLERVVLWPRVIGQAIADGSQTFPNPPSEGSSKERISTNGFDKNKILYSIAWLLLMIFVAMPLAYFLSWWWLLFMPFESMIDAITDVDAVLEALVTWPRMLMKATLLQYTQFPSPFGSSGESSHSDYHEHHGEQNEQHEKQHEHHGKQNEHHEKQHEQHEKNKRWHHHEHHGENKKEGHNNNIV